MIPLFFRLSNMQSRAHLREKHLTAGQFSPAFPTEALTQMNIFSRKLQVFALADLSCCAASSVDLNDRLALLLVVFLFTFSKHHCTQVDATLCRTKARKSLSACGRSRRGCVLKDRPRRSRGHLP